MNGADDLRATFDATPFELGTQMAAQPEFASCAVDKVLAFTYQGHKASEPVRAHLLEEFSKRQDLGTLIENALVARIFGDEALDEAIP